MNLSILSSRTCLPAGSLAVVALAILALALSPAPAGAVAPQTATVLSLTAGYGTIQIKGNVDPGEENAQWWAETSTDNESWSGYPGVFGEFPANTGAHPVEVEISNEQGDPEKVLKGSTRYYVRLVVSNGVTDTFSFVPNQFVTTLAVDPPKVLSVNDATAVTYTTTKISGSVERPTNPAPAFNDRCRIEYVPDSQFVLTGFKTATPVACVPNPVTAPGSNPVSADLIGLIPGATYHYRIVALNAGGSDTVVAPNTFTTTAISPPAVTISAPTLGAGTSVHLSGTINPELGPAAPGLYEVNWRFECTPKCLNSNGELLTGAPILPDNSQHTVSADVVLEHNTEYRVILVATNAGTSATAGPVSVTTPPSAPVARTLGIGAGSDSANLGAKINPLNSPVTYRFEWGPTDSYGSQAPAIPEQLSRADNAFHFVTAPISGLTSGATYHYRVIATNTQSGEESEGADRTFTTLPAPGSPPGCPNDDSRVGASASLPDCRAYEYVTPGLNGFAPAAAWPEVSVEGVRADGGAIAFLSGGAPEAAEGSTAVNTILAQRGATGWLTKSLSAPMLIGLGIGTSRSTVGLSSDLSESVLWTNQPLLGVASPKGTNLYLRRADGSFVVLTRAGAPTAADGGELSGASRDFTRLFIVSTVKQRSADPVTGGNTYEWANGDLKLVTVLPGPGEELAPNGGTLPHGALPAVSDNGTEVLFNAGGFPGLYLRSNGENTVQVSVSKRSTPDPNPVAPAIAVGIAADGSEVLFTSRSELTDNANTGRTLGVPNDHGNDIYSYDVGTGVLTDLTVADDPADVAAGADVEKVVGATRDASYVYFIARGNLAEGATSGERNLYVEHEGTIAFIGTNPTGSTLQGYPFYVTPDGRHAAFMSTEGQTGYDNAGQDEVYRYTYGGGVECGSCRPSGEPPLSGASIVGRALSDDGSRLFFQSDDAVIPKARSGLSNVFEYVDGDLHLLTPGDGVTSLLAGASASGDDVFIATFEKLSPLSQGAFGIYDARVNADVPPEKQPASCQGEGCRGTGTAPPQLSSPGTAKFEAPGTVAAPKSKTVTASKVQVRITVPERGELSVLGRGLTPVKQPASGVETVTLGLTSRADKGRLKRGFFKTTAEILFTSASGALSRAEISVKFKAPAKAKSGK